MDRNGYIRPSSIKGTKNNKIYSFLNYQRNEDEAKYLFLNYQRNKNETKYLFLNYRRNEDAVKYLFLKYRRNEDEAKYLFLNYRRSVNEAKYSFLNYRRNEDEAEYLFLNYRWFAIASQEDHKPFAEVKSNDLVQPACFSFLPLLNFIHCAFVIQIYYWGLQYINLGNYCSLVDYFTDATIGIFSKWF